MFKSITSRTAEQAATDEANLQWQAERRSLRPQAASAILGSSRLSDIKQLDPAVERAREKAAREVANKEHKQSTRAASLAHRKQILGQPYSGSPLMMDLLNTCGRLTPSRQLSAQDYRIVATMGRDQANEFLTPPLTDAEAVTVMQFFHVQVPTFYPDSSSWIVACDILTAENVIRQSVFFEPVQAEPEPVEEQNPYKYSDHTGSDYAKWERSQLVRDFDKAHVTVFRAGLKAATEDLGGIELSEADVRLVRDKCSNLPFHEWTSERIKNVALATFGGPNAVQRDPEDALSATQFLQAHGLGSSVMREGR